MITNSEKQLRKPQSFYDIDSMYSSTDQIIELLTKALATPEAQQQVQQAVADLKEGKGESIDPDDL